MKPIKKFILRALILAVLFTLPASGVAMAVPDYIKDAPTYKFQTQAREIVKHHNELLYKRSIPFAMGDIFPTARDFSEMKDFHYIILQNLDIFSKMGKEARKSIDIDRYIKAYDEMMAKRTDFFGDVVYVIGDREKFWKSHYSLRETLERWNKNEIRNTLYELREQRLKAGEAFKRMKRDYAELKKMYEKVPWDPNTLSKDNVIRISLEARRLKWPLVKDEVKKLEFNKLYGLEWLNKDLSKFNDRTKTMLQFWDNYVEKELRTAQSKLDLFIKAVKVVYESNKKCQGYGDRVVSLASSYHGKNVALQHGLAEAMLEAGKIEQIYFKCYNELEMGRALKDIESFKRLLSDSLVKQLLGGDYLTYITVSPRAKKTMMEAAELSSNVMNFTVDEMANLVK